MKYEKRDTITDNFLALACSIMIHSALLIAAYVYYFPMYASAKGNVKGLGETSSLPRTMAINLNDFHATSNQEKVNNNLAEKPISTNEPTLPSAKLPERVIAPLGDQPKPLSPADIVLNQPNALPPDDKITIPDQPSTSKDAPSPSPQGEPEPTETDDPTVDDRGIYAPTNRPTKATGASLELTGWIWDVVPRPDDDTPEVGKLVFEITIDADGEVLAIKTLEKTVSPVVEQLYKDEVAKLAFSKTKANRNLSPTSTGKVTFILQYQS